ncbi:MAG: T9SS type A sorting domain-containing protein [candidate division Zixibacteria bacterium]|nr:T9SS type A sorting domain-containing protein [candidate division Zixibacteria bacterium]
MKLIKILSFLFLSLFLFSIGNANPIMGVLITEISTEPDWFEISTDYNLSLSDYVLVCNNDTFRFSQDSYIDEGQYLVFDTEDFPALNFPEEGAIIRWLMYDEPMQEFKYGIYGPHPAPPPGTSIGQDYGYFWWGNGDATLYFQPTPGNPNPLIEPDRGNTQVVLNEINVNSHWGSSDFVELYKMCSGSFSIAGWKIVGNSVYTIPNGTELNHYYTLREDNSPSFFSSLNADRDNIYLFNAQNVLVDQVGWSSDHGENTSFMRYPDGDCHVFDGWSDNTSPDFNEGFPSKIAFNRYDCPGFVVKGAEAFQEEDAVVLNWTDPVWDGGFDISELVRNEEYFPADVNDGELVYAGGDESFIDREVELNHTYYYTVFARDLNGSYGVPTDESQAMVTLLPLAGIDDDEIIPSKTTLYQNVPNPFNASTKISFGLERPGVVKLTVFDILGREIQTLVDGFTGAGVHNIQFDAGEHSSGVYFYKLVAGDKVVTKRMTLLK